MVRERVGGQLQLSGSEYPSAESSWQKSEGTDPALSYSWTMIPDHSRDSSSKASSVLLPVCQSQSRNRRVITCTKGKNKSQTSYSVSWHKLAKSLPRHPHSPRLSSVSDFLFRVTGSAPAASGNRAHLQQREVSQNLGRYKHSKFLPSHVLHPNKRQVNN